MIAPALHPEESKRLRAVRSYNLLDTIPEKEYDAITSLIASICHVPISLVTVLDADRNFLKSHHGTPLNDVPRNITFCGHAILDEKDIFIIEDARLDERFENNPLVKEHNAIFYAGVKLEDADGYPLGTLCIFDTKPRKLTALQKEALISLSDQVVNLFTARRQNIHLTKVKDQLKERNNELKDFAGTVSHDLKMPLANMILTADIVKSKYSTDLDEKGKEYLGYIKKSSLSLSEYITRLLEHYESEHTADNEKESFDLNHLLEDIVELLDIKHDCEINFPEFNIELDCNRAALEQILLNLIGNAIKYNDKKKPIIIINCQNEGDYCRFEISDNGVGIPKDKITQIFDLFSTVGNLDRFGNKGSGIGLSTVRKLVDRLGGAIEVQSTENEGTTFIFTVEN